MKLRLNPSGAHTWTECTAQPHYVVQFKHILPASDTNYNREGSVGHKVVEYQFTGTEVPSIKDKWWDGFGSKKSEMERHADGFVKLCRSLQGEGATWWSERKVKLFYAPESHGFIDFSAFTPEGDLIIADYKYGQGVAVTAEENLQMAIYAVSLIEMDRPDFDRFATVTMVIYQPRVRQGEPLTKWTLTYGELLQFVEERVRIPAEDIRGKALTLKFAPSTKVCQFCPAAGFCGLDEMSYTDPVTKQTSIISLKPNFPYSGQLRAEALLDDTPLAPIRKGLAARLDAPETLEEDLLAKLVLKEKEITKWLGDCADYANLRLTSGGKVKGLKLVQGKGAHRRWRDEEDAKEFLLAHCAREDVITEKVVTPAQADKLQFDLPKEEWTQLQKLVVKPEGGPVIAAENDPRPVYGLNKAAEYFDDESEEEWI